MQVQIKCGGEIGTKVLGISQETTTWELKQRLNTLCGMKGISSLMTLVHGGRRLADSAVVASLNGGGGGATLHLAFRLLGGGGDGGTTGAESRSCYLEMYRGKRAETVDPAEQRQAKWGCCHLTGEPLRPPCAVDELGNLFNKEPLLAAMIEKSLPASLSYISSIKHIINVRLSDASSGGGEGPRPAAVAAAASGRADACRFACPLTGLPMNGKYKFVVLMKRRDGNGGGAVEGLAISEKAVKEVPSAVEELLGGSWDEHGVIVINPAGDALEAARTRLSARLQASAIGKKDRKKRKVEAPATAAVDDVADAAVVTAPTPASLGSAHVPAATAGLPKKRLPSVAAVAAAAAEAAVSSKRPKAATTGGAGVRVPQGATASVYNSLFSDGSEDRARETYCTRAMSVTSRGLPSV